MQDSLIRFGSERLDMSRSAQRVIATAFSPVRNVGKPEASINAMAR
jgi:hypothetical protein